MNITVKVIPRSSKTELVGYLADGTWKVKVAAVPEKGKANKELCAFLAEHFGVPQSHVSILSGQTAHVKRIQIADRK